MRIAIPIAQGVLSQHFGHCEQLAFIDVDPASRAILATNVEDAPPHETGGLPRLLAERGTQVVIAGNMGGGARALLSQAGIIVLAGADSRPPEAVVKEYLAGTLVQGSGTCDHHHRCH